MNKNELNFIVDKYISQCQQAQQELDLLQETFFKNDLQLQNEFQQEFSKQIRYQLVVFSHEKEHDYDFSKTSSYCILTSLKDCPSSHIAFWLHGELVSYNSSEIYKLYYYLAETPQQLPHLEKFHILDNTFTTFYFSPRRNPQEIRVLMHEVLQKHVSLTLEEQDIINTIKSKQNQYLNIDSPPPSWNDLIQ